MLSKDSWQCRTSSSFRLDQQRMVRNFRVPTAYRYWLLESCAPQLGAILYCNIPAGCAIIPNAIASIRSSFRANVPPSRWPYTHHERCASCNTIFNFTKCRDQGPGEPDRPDNSYSNNTLSLPRDLSITQTGQLRQKFAPELAQLRTTHTHVGTQPLAVGGVPKAQFIKGGAGLQLEIVATFSRDPATLEAGKFGILVFAATNLSEYTAIAFDSAREQFLLDRRHSGLAADEDVRGGPWPEPQSASVTVHAYIDHAVVEMIANATLVDKKTGAYLSDASTPIAAWVNPTSPSSMGVALFSEVEGVTLERLDLWQLESPTHTTAHA